MFAHTRRAEVVRIVRRKYIYRMTGGALGGGVLFVALAVLWVVVLVPSWARGREFRAAEQNAARLQRTLRVLAETAEVPQEHRVEATAKEALAHEKKLLATKKRQDADRRTELQQFHTKQLLAEQEEKRAQQRHHAAQRAEKMKSKRFKTLRLMLAAIALFGVVGVAVGTVVAVVGQTAVILGWSVFATGAASALLVALAPGRQPAPSVAHTERTARPESAVRFDEIKRSDSAATTQAHAEAQAQAAQRLERARALARARATSPTAQAERENRPDSILLQEARATVQKHRAEQHASDAVVEDSPKQNEPITPTSQTPGTGGQAPVLDVAARSRNLAVQARLRQMGVVGDTAEGMPDLDETLKRRRDAG